MNLKLMLCIASAAVCLFSGAATASTQPAPSVGDRPVSQEPRAERATSATPAATPETERPLLMAPDCTSTKCFFRSQSPSAEAYKDAHKEQPVLMAPSGCRGTYCSQRGIEPLKMAPNCPSGGCVRHGVEPLKVAPTCGTKCIKAV